MRSRVEELRQQFPRVRPLTDEEVAALADVAFRRFGARSTQSERLVAALMLVILLPLGLWMTAWMWVPILGAVYDRFGTAGPVVVIIGLPIAGLLLLRLLVVTDRVEMLRVTGLLEDDRGFSHCLDCGYKLDGLAHIDDRPGVVRCPECGLVNPTPITHQSS